MSLGELNTEVVAAAARSVRRPPQWPSYCPLASDAAILGVTVSNDCYLRKRDARIRPELTDTVEKLGN